MASSCYSSFSSVDQERLDLQSIWGVVSLINQHIVEFLSDAKTRVSFKSRCFSKLNIQKQEFFEFSDHSILSNLYWGIENVEAAIEAKWPEEKASKLTNVEELLQFPALLNEDGITAGIANSYLICCSYFYLSLVRKLQRDEWQVALHFLQAILVSPSLVWMEFTPDSCQNLYRLCFGLKMEEMGSGNNGVFEGVRRKARRYKDRLMYYQVMSYGENQWDTESLLNGISSSNESAESIVYRTDWPIYHQFEKVHPFDPQENVRDEMAGQVKDISEQIAFQDHRKTVTDWEKIYKRRASNIKCVQDVLKESDSVTPVSSYADFEEENDLEAYIDANGSLMKSRRVIADDREVEVIYEQFSLPRDKLEEEISKLLCISEGYSENYNEEYTVRVSTFYEILNGKAGTESALTKDGVLNQLLTAMSTSKEEEVIRASMSILLSIISSNRSVIEDIKKKGLNLCDLASALKRNVHEAAVFIYLINPSPKDLNSLELLSKLVEIVCNSKIYNGRPSSHMITPPEASLMIIEVLVSAFGTVPNNSHLDIISSPEVISALINVTRNDNVEELRSLASILGKCMQFDGKCRKYILEFIQLDSFLCLLRSCESHAKFVALEFLNEVLRVPRSSAINQLQQMRKAGSINIMHLLMPCLQKSPPRFQLLAANLVLQLDMLEETSNRKSIFREEAVEVLLESVASVEDSSTQLLAARILSNLGGTYAWTGEPYTVAWLVKRAGLTSHFHRNLIKNVDWLDQSLQDDSIDIWSRRIARNIIKFGNLVFHALEEGLKSKIKRISCDCLTAIALLGREIAKCPDSVRYPACEILLSGIEQFLHPGFELEERLLACYCIYNYTSHIGMQKLVNFSEGVRESLRRLSGITWMAEELLKVAVYFCPNKLRISCVHTQILEAGQKFSGAVTALIFYRGQLYSGHSDGSIKVWDIKGQSAALVWNIKEHKRAVTGFSLFEPGDALLSGSADKTIRVWRMIKRKVVCIEVIVTKDPIQSIDSFGKNIFITTQSHKMKVIDEARIIKDICKNKQVKCIKEAQGKVYIGCMDSSIQELSITKKLEREIKAPTKSWIWMHNRSINSITVYKDWLYSASAIVEGSNIKDWKRRRDPQISIVTAKGAKVLAIGVVEDFVYLNCSSSSSTLQIWLRETKQKVGRLSAGSRITSLLTANDIIFCGTEMGSIKGWIPL